MDQTKTNSTNLDKWVLLATILASGMAFLESTAVNLAIPTIQAKFAASLGQIEWLVNSFALSLAAFLLIGGSLGDRFGRKKVFLSGIFLFALSSLGCGLAPSFNFLIVARFIQGIAAAIMIPGSLAIINVSFKSESRGRAIGLWSGLAGAVAAIGPFLGGWLVQAFGWPSVFFINVPIGILAFFIGLKFISETYNEEQQSLDWRGTIFITASLSLLALGLIEGVSRGFGNSLIVVSLVLALVLFVVFILIERKVKNPIVPFEIFRNQLVLGANLATLFLYFALNGLIFFLVLNLQQVQGFSPLKAGMALLPGVLLISFFSGPAGSLADRIGPRKPMIIGPLLVSIGMFIMTIPSISAHYFTTFFPGIVLFGLGMSLVIAPLTKSALSVEEKFSGSASGVNNAVSRIAALLAVAALGAIAATIFTATLNTSINQSNLDPQQKQNIISQSNKLGGITVSDDFGSAKSQAEKIVKTSFVKSFRVIMSINAILAFLSAVISFIYIRPQSQTHGQSRI